MSYDISLYVIDEKTREPLYINNVDMNITYNVMGMMKAASYDQKGFRDWDGMEGYEVAQRCVKILRELDSMPDYYRKLEPDNGWGTMEHLKEFLGKLRDECCLAPSARLRVS